MNENPLLSAASPLVDAHTDLLLELAFRGHALGEADPFAARWLPELLRGGVALQVCPAFPDLDRQPEGALRQILGQIAAFHAAARAHPDRVVAVRDGADLDVVARGDRIGLLLALEGAEPIGFDLWMLDVLYELGVRMVGLTWNRRNQFADGVAETGAGGLSRIGRELVSRCAELGLVVDLAHASERTFWDVLEHPAAPHVVVSHASCRAVFDHPRNLADDQLRGLASRGGVLGIMLHPLVLGPGADVGRAVDHIDYAVAVMGSDHVGLGGDFTRQVVRALGHVIAPDALLPEGMALDAALEELAGPGDYPTLVTALRERGYGGTHLAAVLGGSFLRVFREAFGAGS